MTLRICRQAFEDMVAHLQAVYPEEGCGLLSGSVDLACRHIAVPNALRSETAFRMAPREQIAALLAIEEAGEHLLALYHSHPRGPAGPSDRDIAEAAYPDVTVLVVSLAEFARPQVGAFRLGTGVLAPVDWEVV